MAAADTLGTTPLTTRASGRLTSLDILRGLAILMMILSGMLPKTLPNWVDHGYQPHYKPDPITGTWVSALGAGGDAVFDGRWKAYTWVDLVFPMFLFSMGAAIPIALARQRERFVPDRKIVGGIFGRWLTLIAFAIILDNIIPPTTPTSNPDTTRLLALASFGVAFLFFMRWPANTPKSVQRSVRLIAGIVLAVRIAGYAVRRTDLGPSQFFNWGRSDIIILVLAHCYLVAALTWLFTERRPMLRLLLLLPLMLLAHYCAINPTAYPDWLWMGGTIGHLSVPADWPWTVTVFTLHDQPWHFVDLVQSPKLLLNLPHWFKPIQAHSEGRPWLAPATNFAPLWDFTWYKFLFAVVPGTIVGDWLYRWSRRHSVNELTPRPLSNAWLTFGVALLVCVGVFVGLRHYGYPTLYLGGPMRTPFVALVLAVPLMVLLGWLSLPTATGEHWIERRLFKTGAATLGAGLLLACAPIGRTADGHGWRFFEGGISKGPPSTLSYYATSIGLCCVLLVGLIRLFDSRRAARSGVGPIAATGQNPLLAYYIGHAAFGALFGLSLLGFLGQPFGPRFTTLDDLFGAQLVGHAWLHALGDLAKTGLIVAFVWGVTRARIFWRA